MTRGTTILVLLFAAALESGGDALLRSALRTSQVPVRILLFAAGAVVLFAYGCVVNTPSWDFGRLLGLYVVFFFVMAQIIAWMTFGQIPSRSLLVGGMLIVTGGLVIALSER
jgi:small multidrug resistance family-3 protein